MPCRPAVLFLTWFPDALCDRRSTRPRLATPIVAALGRQPALDVLTRLRQTKARRVSRRVQPKRKIDKSSTITRALLLALKHGDGGARSPASTQPLTWIAWLEACWCVSTAETTHSGSSSSPVLITEPMCGWVWGESRQKTAITSSISSHCCHHHHHCYCHFRSSPAARPARPLPPPQTECRPSTPGAAQ